VRRDPLSGQTIGPYRLVEQIDGDGRGEVYRAEHPRLGARVAVKVLSAELASRPAAVEQFFRDARAANVIRHEKIVDILDLGTLDDGRPFIVMEHLDGATLARVLEPRTPLPIGPIARLVVEVLEALAAAHARGIVHEGLRPDTIFVSPAGHAKVLGFGAARLALAGAERPRRPRSSAVLGVPYYQAPEQAAGTGEPDARADLYAAGAILFEGVTGARPFDGATALPGVPRALAAAIRRALEKDPARRFQSAREMADAITEAVRGLPDEPPIAPPVPTPPTPGTPGKRAHTGEHVRERWRLLLAGALVAAAAAALALALAELLAPR
jgi:serine/threonine-protein kinase